MGLDMYLHKRHYVGNKYRDPEKQVRVEVPKNQEGVTFKTKTIKNDRISEITEEVAYWRKANAIHKWFRENVIESDEDNGGDHYVSREDLTELRDLCRKVLAASELVDAQFGKEAIIFNGYKYTHMVNGKKIKDPTVANELLPTTDGFFFGSTDYDQYYIDDIKYTEETLTQILEEDDASEFYYHASY